jgi:hypothetical protein
MRRWITVIVVLTGVALVGLAAFALLSPATTDEERTLGSLEKVLDCPLYVMTYYADYGFGEIVGRDAQTGVDAESGSPWACTTFAALGEGGDAILGRNFDWYYRGALLLFTNPPGGYASVSLVDLNALGYREDVDDLLQGDRRGLLEAPYRPFDGMNEAGVAVGMMAVPHAEAAPDPGEMTITSLQAIRLILDYAGDVDEAVDLLEGYGISFGGGPPLHYLIADASGDSAIVEFIDDEMHVLHSEEPWQVSSNFVVARALPEGARSGCRRYNSAYRALEAAGGVVSLEEAIAILELVRQPHTMWSVVYGVSSGDVRVAMGGDYEAVASFRLDVMRNRRGWR